MLRRGAADVNAMRQEFVRVGSPTRTICTELENRHVRQAVKCASEVMVVPDGHALSRK